MNHETYCIKILGYNKEGYDEILREIVSENDKFLLIKLQEESVSELWSTPENDIWDEYYNDYVLSSD
jgi:hypothetical protein